MSFLRSLFARLTGIFTGHRADDDLRAELEAHVAIATDENIRRGMDPVEARRQALITSGGLTVAEEAVRSQRGLPWLESIAADIRYGVRALRHAPGFTAVVILTLGLGVGANTAIFSVIRGVLLKPLPHRDGQRLVYLRHSNEGMAGSDITFSVPEVRDFRQGVPSLAGIAEYSSWSAIHQTNDGSTRWDIGLVTGNYFEVMGLAPMLGRLTKPFDDGPAAAPVAVLTFEGWMNRFGGDASIVGKQLRLDGRAVEVIGVLEPAPFFPDRVEALLNMVNSDHHMGASMNEGRSHRMTRVVAREAPDANIDRVRAEIAATYQRMRKDHPQHYDAASRYRVDVVPLRQILGERARFTLWLLMGAAALVLIIAVANVANLTLMRGVKREHELVVRAALGAGVTRLRRLLLVENLLLASGGAALGVVIAIAGVQLLTSLVERYSPRASEINLDGVVLVFTVALSAAVALLLSVVGWIPAEGRVGGLVEGTRRVIGSRRKQRLQRGLVVAQVAVSVVLLSGAGLLTRTLMQLSDVDTGLRTEQVLTMQISGLLGRDEARRNPEARAAAGQRFQEIRREIEALPGVLEVGVGSTLPLRRSGVVWEVMVEGKPLASGQAPVRAESRAADPNYFGAAGIPILKGRAFASTDDINNGRWAVINETLARRLFPDEDPIGRRIAWTGEIIRQLYPRGQEWRTVVGVVGDTRDGELEAPIQPVVFEPIVGASGVSLMAGGLVIRAASNASALPAAATAVVRRIVPQALIEDMMTIRQFKSRSVSPRRLNAALISSFGMLALIIAAVGIGGVLAFSVSARTSEIGIRMSLGAGRGAIERMILAEGGVLVIVGLGLGLSGALAGGRVIQGMLFGVTPNDPLTLVIAAVVMSGIGVVACWIPALRAARVDPAITMRSQ